MLDEFNQNQEIQFE
jgi:hypothetical protein